MLITRIIINNAINTTIDSPTIPDTEAVSPFLHLLARSKKITSSLLPPPVRKSFTDRTSFSTPFQIKKFTGRPRGNAQNTGHWIPGKRASFIFALGKQRRPRLFPPESDKSQTWSSFKHGRHERRQMSCLDPPLPTLIAGESFNPLPLLFPKSWWNACHRSMPRFQLPRYTQRSERRGRRGRGARLSPPPLVPLCPLPLSPLASNYKLRSRWKEAWPVLASALLSSTTRNRSIKISPGERGLLER